MKIIIFGLSISSAWGNGHATLLRGLLRALNNRGHEIHFFERDTPYYAAHRDAASFPFVELHLYAEWNDVLAFARRELSSADVGIVTSYCGDGAAACNLVLDARLPRAVFYDMDTPVTLSRLDLGEAVPYLPPQGLNDFDLVLSYTGGQALYQLRDKLSARCVAALYGWVDPEIYYPAEVDSRFEASVSYLGTYSADRQAAFKTLFLDVASELREQRFIVGGAMYPNVQNWSSNVRYLPHVAPPDHRAFYSSSPLTLNVTRGSMAAMGYCPSGRLFEAAACGTVVLSDWWEGLDTFFEPRSEILIAKSTAEAVSAIRLTAADIRAIATRARERVLACHTADIRAQRLISLLEQPRDEGRRPQESLCVARGA